MYKPNSLIGSTGSWEYTRCNNQRHNIECQHTLSQISLSNNGISHGSFIAKSHLMWFYHGLKRKSQWLIEFSPQLIASKEMWEIPSIEDDNLDSVRLYIHWLFNHWASNMLTSCHTCTSHMELHIARTALSRAEIKDTPNLAIPGVCIISFRCLDQDLRKGQHFYFVFCLSWSETYRKTL